MQRLLDYPDLVKQTTTVNSKKQFMESQDFQSAVVDNQDAHNTMADYFFSDGPAIIALADAFHEEAIDQQTDR